MSQFDTSSIIEAFRTLSLAEMTVIMPALIASFVVAIVFGIIQAATQIQEQTLSFFPKLIVLAFIFYYFGDWMFQIMSQGFDEYIKSIPEILR